MRSTVCARHIVRVCVTEEGGGREGGGGVRVVCRVVRITHAQECRARRERLSAVDCMMDVSSLT